MKRERLSKNWKRERERGEVRITLKIANVILPDVILSAMDAEGLDGRGREGIIGAMRVLFKTEKPAFARLLEKMLPLMVNQHQTGSVAVEYSDRTALLERFKERGLPVPPSLITMPAHGDGLDEKPN